MSREVHAPRGQVDRGVDGDLVRHLGGLECEHGDLEVVRRRERGEEERRRRGGRRGHLGEDAGEGDERDEVVREVRRRRREVERDGPELQRERVVLRLGAAHAHGRPHAVARVLVDVEDVDRVREGGEVKQERGVERRVGQRRARAERGARRRRARSTAPRRRGVWRVRGTAPT